MIDINKKYRTRDGREVRIYATDGIFPYEVHGSIKSTVSDGWLYYAWSADGSHHRDAILSLIEVRPRHKRTVWLNVYETEIHFSYDTKEEADSSVRRPKRLACIKVELDFEEGDGL